MFNIDDIDVVRGGGSNFNARVEDRATSGAAGVLNRGEPVKRNNLNFAFPIADGDPERGTDMLIGVAQSESTETGTTGGDGFVDVLQIIPSTLLRGRATTAANINTQALLDGVRYDSVAFDVTGTVITIDENEGDDPNVHGLVIVDGDIVAGTLEVYVHIQVTLNGTTI